MKSDPASFCCSQNCAAASDTEVGKKNSIQLSSYMVNPDLSHDKYGSDFIGTIQTD